MPIFIDKINTSKDRQRLAWYIIPMLLFGGFCFLLCYFIYGGDTKESSTIIFIGKPVSMVSECASKVAEPSLLPDSGAE